MVSVDGCSEAPPSVDRSAERGATLVVAALFFMVIIAVAAVVVDLAAARSDRAANQLAADSAVTAGATQLLDLGAEEACETAVAYFEEIVDEAVVGIDCSAFPAACNGATAPVTESGTAGALAVEIVHPIADDHPLMASSAIGAPGQPVLADDGGRCERLGVAVNETRATFFGGAVDSEQLTTSIHAVALATVDEESGRAINLLLLERVECDVLTKSGGGSGGITVGAVVDPDTGELRPGKIAIDSDGSAGCGGDGTIDVDGSDSVIRADGPSGCIGELLPAGSGAGCGVIEVFAPGPPGCNLPACSSSGTVAPDPVSVASRLTRAQVDWRYNCKASYPLALDIQGCPDAAGSHPYLDQLIAAIGPSGIPAGFQSYSAAGHPCAVDGPPSTVVTIPQGNWVVDCDLTVKRELRFVGGNIVFDGDVSLESSAVLAMNHSNSQSFQWSDGDAFDATESSSQAAFAYLRNGTLSKSGQASLRLPGVMVYLSPSSWITMSGGAGSLEWAGPTTGPFEDLALWSDGTTTHNFAGQAGLTMEGVFFVPHTTVTYAGSSGQQQVAAQFISEKLQVSGSGLLTMTPDESRAVIFPEPNASTLIR